MMKKAKYILTLAVLLASLILGSLSTYSEYSANEQLVTETKQEELRKVSVMISNAMQTTAAKASGRAAFFVRLRSVKEAFRQGDRDKIEKAVQPDFLVLKEKFGTIAAQFFLPPAISFLQIYEPTQGIGEDLSSSRDIILETAKKQQPQQGLEVGHHGLSIHGVDIVKDKKGFIGMLDIGMSFSDVLINIKKNTGFETAAFVDNELFTRVATFVKKMPSERILGGFLNIESTDWDLIRKIVTPDLLMKANDVTFKIKTINGVDYGLVLVPLLDFRGTDIGSVIAVKDFDNFQLLLHTDLVRNFIFIGIQSLVLSVMTFFVCLLKEKSIKKNL